MAPYLRSEETTLNFVELDFEENLLYQHSGKDYPCLSEKIELEVVKKPLIEINLRFTLQVNGKT